MAPGLIVLHELFTYIGTAMTAEQYQMLDLLIQDLYGQMHMSVNQRATVLKLKPFFVRTKNGSIER